MKETIDPKNHPLIVIEVEGKTTITRFRMPKIIQLHHRFFTHRPIWCDILDRFIKDFGIKQAETYRCGLHTYWTWRAKIDGFEVLYTGGYAESIWAVTCLTVRVNKGKPFVEKSRKPDKPVYSGLFAEAWIVGRKNNDCTVNIASGLEKDVQKRLEELCEKLLTKYGLKRVVDTKSIEL